MTMLSAQSIQKLCTGDSPMISPFVGEKTVINGASYGLSAASYDVRIGHDLMLGPNPVRLLGEMARKWPAHPRMLSEWGEKLENYPPDHALAHTVEDFDMPDNVAGLVTDKSTYARRFLSAMNTFIDCGFRGNLTLELVNLGSELIELKAGDPVCQILFYRLDEPSERPYAGKFQNQTKAPHGPRYENEDGTWRR